MRNLIVTIFVLLGLLAGNAVAQEDVNIEFDTLDAFGAAIEEAIANNELDAFWDALVANGRIPYIVGYHVVFLYRGEAESVVWRGDFTGWERGTAIKGRRIAESDVWGAVIQLPSDARVDYKIVLNDSTWILDPAHEHTQLGGFGPNSVLSMPDYTPSDWVIPRDDIAHGTLTDWMPFESASLSYTVNYRVYLPPEADSMASLPVIYVIDGQEYSHDAMGSMVIVLDNLIADAMITPVMAVFIDPRNPETLVNRRDEEFLDNPDYLAFITQEFVPYIDSTYATDPSPGARAILGTSFGGVAVSYIGLQSEHLFGLIGIQSPAFWASREVPRLLTDFIKTGEAPDVRIYVASGNPNWDLSITSFVSILEALEIPFDSMTVNEGHSWGQWRAQLDDILIFFFGL